MTAQAWEGVLHELDLWSDRGLRAKFWVRDDDAYEMSAPLARLYDLADRHNVNIGLAVIPGKVRSDFVEILSGMKQHFHPMCHGWMHTKFGPPDAPNEFGRDRPYSALWADAELALKVFSEYFRSTDAIFVPPYGRITLRLRRALQRIGYAAVSMGPGLVELKLLRMSSALPWMPFVTIPKVSQFPRFDVHIDVLDWERRTARDKKVVAAELVENLRLRRKAFPAYDRPIGLLTHHLAHDEQVWQLCDDLMKTLSAHEAVDFLNADSLIDSYRRQLTGTNPSVRISSVRAL